MFYEKRIFDIVKFRNLNANIEVKYQSFNPFIRHALIPRNQFIE